MSRLVYAIAASLALACSGCRQSDSAAGHSREAARPDPGVETIHEWREGDTAVIDHFRGGRLFQRHRLFATRGTGLIYKDSTEEYPAVATDPVLRITISIDAKKVRKKLVEIGSLESGAWGTLSESTEQPGKDGPCVIDAAGGFK